MNIQELHEIFENTSGISIDTRIIKKKSFYFALKGPRFDGNFFAKEALERGASFCVVDSLKYEHKNIFLVNDVLNTLQSLASFHRRKLNIPVIALTGSNGKTTSKELISNVLSKKYKITATKGNLNNLIGVPLTLLSMNSSSQIAIIEMGANRQGEIEKLCKIASPNYGYVTNFGKAHLEGFGGFEGVIKGKTELYKYLEQAKGKVFVNQNDSLQVKHSKNTKQIFFKKEAFQLIKNCDFVTLKYKDTFFESNLLGDYNFNNIAAAIAMGIYFKVPLNAIKNAIKEYVPKNNRSQIIQKSGYKIISDAYNANPTSVQLALENFQKTNFNKKIIILGDMFELGKYALSEHRNIVNKVAKINADAYFIGEIYYKVCGDHANKFKNIQDFHIYLKKNPLQKKSFILIKGSRSMALEQILEWL